jgi:hypothetical protein
MIVVIVETENQQYSQTNFRYVLGGNVDFVDKRWTQDIFFYHMDSHEFKKELMVLYRVFFSDANGAMLKVCFCCDVKITKFKIENSACNVIKNEPLTKVTPAKMYVICRLWR